MPHRILSPAIYITVLVVLLAFTVLTAAVSFLPLSGLAHLVAGQAIGVVKASLVILFFMHAIESPHVTWAVIAVTVFWLVAVFMVLTFSDYFTRGLVPFMPGH
jgi:cytochrome c oxidase subunit 4